MQASVRNLDRVVVQVGGSLGERADCEIVDLTTQQEADLRAAFDQPHGKVYLAANGAVTFDPPPPAPAPDPQDVADRIDIDAFMAAAPGTATAVQRDRVIQALIRRAGWRAP